MFYNLPHHRLDGREKSAGLGRVGGRPTLGMVTDLMTVGYVIKIDDGHRGLIRSKPTWLCQTVSAKCGTIGEILARSPDTTAPNPKGPGRDPSGPDRALAESSPRRVLTQLSGQVAQPAR